MDIEKQKQWLGFFKFLVGTVVLGLVSTLISYQMQRKEIELKQMDQLGTYTDQVLTDKLEERRTFAKFISTVSQSPGVRERWKEWYDIVDRDYRNLKAEIDSLQDTVLAMDSRDVIEAEKLKQLQQKLDEAEFTLSNSGFSKEGKIVVTAFEDGTLLFGGTIPVDAQVIKGENCKTGRRGGDETTVQCAPGTSFRVELSPGLRD